MSNNLIIRNDNNSTSQLLRFSGQINTNGGGFASIRSALPDTGLLLSSSDKDNDNNNTVKGIKIRYRGDGKTYKVILSDGQRSTGGPFLRSPTWQMDLPTTASTSTVAVDTIMDEAILPLDKFQPSFGPRSVSEEEKAGLVLVPGKQRMIGLMLSLKLSDGTDNPRETFGEGVFEFSLDVEAIEVV